MNSAYQRFPEQRVMTSNVLPKSSDVNATQFKIRKSNKVQMEASNIWDRKY